MKRFKKGKSISIALILMMVIQLMMPVNFAYAAGEIDVEDRIDKAKTEADINIYANGELKEPEADGNYKDIPADAEIELYYNFFLLNSSGDDEDDEDYDYHKGDYFTLEFPSPVKFNIPDEGLELKRGEDVIGILTIAGSLATITLTEKVVKKSDINLEFKIKGTFKSDIAGSGEPVKIDLGYGGKTIEIGFAEPEQETVNLTLVKEDPILDLDNGEIEWKIKVTVEDGKAASGVVLKDKLSANQTYVKGSFIIVGVTSTAITASSITFSAIGGSEAFEYAFPEPIQGTKTVTYRTKITDMTFSDESSPNTDIKFKNYAEAFIGNDRKAYDTKTKTLNWINKKAELADDGKKIMWTIIINNYDGLLNGKSPTIVDTIGEKHDFVNDPNFPVKIKLDNKKASDVEEGTNAGNYSLSGKTLTYKFGAESFNKAELTYYTEINNPGATDNKNYDYKNDAKLLWGENTAGPSHKGSIGIGKGIIEKSVLGNNDYSDGMLINWTVTINKNRVEILNALFEDTIPAGLIFKPESFKLNGNVVEPSVMNNKITYTIIGTITTPQAITYSTLVDKNYEGLFLNGNTGFTNSASLTGTGITGVPSDSVTKNVMTEVIAKTVGNYDYNSRIVKWEITINKSGLPLKGVTLSDLIPEGMEFLSETFKIDGTAPENDALEFIQRNESSTRDKFIFNMGDIIGNHVITYETKVLEEYLSETDSLNKVLKFKNEAEINAMDRKSVKTYAEVSVNNYIVQKNGERTGFDFVKWSVPINSNKVSLKDVVLTDTLQAGLALDVNSVKLFKLNIDGNGNPTKGDEINLSEEEVKYDYSYVESRREFTFEFKGSFNEAYLLEFVTDVVTDRITIKNTIEFNGESQNTSSTADDLYVDVSNWTGSGSTSKGSVKIKKIDDKGNPLIGAKFKFYDKNGNYYESVPSDENDGITEYIDLPFRLYYIQEMEAPDGYLLDKTIKTIKLSSTEVATLSIENTKALADIEFFKKGNEEAALFGVGFKLFEDGVQIGDESFSNIDGKVVFKEIKPGTYTVRETTTPEVYKPLGADIEVIVQIDDDGTGMEVLFNGEIYEDGFVVENELVDVYADVKLNKAGKAENSKGETLYTKALQGAKFDIYRWYGEGEEYFSSISGEDGSVDFGKLPEGNYIIRESEPPAGYTMSNDEVYVEVYRNPDKLDQALVSYRLAGDNAPTDEVITLVNKAINIEFIKKDTSGNPLAGAEFTLFDADGEPVESFGPVTSNEFGEVIFTAVPAGSYIIKETQAPNGYKDYNKEIYVDIDLFDYVEAVIIFTVDGEDVEFEDGMLIVENEKKPGGGGGGSVYGKIAIKKVDEDKKVLSGAEFSLYDVSGKLVEKGLTGSDGTLSFGDLKPGQYVLKETKAPEGYVLEANETDVILVGNRTNTYTFTNKKEEPKKPGRIEIIKTGEDGKLLSGAWFSLVDDKGLTLQNIETLDGKGAFEDVPVGRYTVKEVQAPEGYEILDQAVSVTVESEETITLRFVNQLKGEVLVPAKGSIIINKVDENKTPLSGAEFTLYNENKEIIKTALSDKDGKVVFSDLKDGKYFVKETMAPEGYEIVSDELTVNIAGENSYSYRFVNVSSDEDINDPDIPKGWEEIDDPEIPADNTKLPDTGSLLNTWTLAMMGILLIAAGLFLGRKKAFDLK